MAQMKAIGYCRVSSEEQVKEGFSLETQENEIKSYCFNNNIDLLNVYIDGGVSAYKNSLNERPQGRFILDHIFNEDIDCVIAISDDRMFRQISDSLAVREICNQHNVKLIYTRQQHYKDMDPASGFLIENLNAMFNEYQSLTYAVKSKEGLKNKARKGEWNGQAPFGYKLVSSHLQIEEEKANIIKLIFDLYLTKSWGAEKICNYLNENNITPPKNSKYWSKTSILCMLKNEAYTGITVFNKRAPVRSGRKYNPQNEWIVKENTHQAIISKEDFDKVQSDMEGKRRNINAKNIDRTKTSNAPLAGLLFCSNCGNVYTYTSGVGKTGTKLYYYQCGSKRHGKTVCSRRMIPAPVIEKFVLYRIQKILTSEMYKERFEEQLKIRLESLQAKKKDINNIKNAIKSLTTQKEKFLTLIADEDDMLLIETYKEKLKSILGQISLQNSLMEQYSEINIKNEEIELRKQFELNYEDITYKDFQDLDKDQLKVLFNKLIENIIVKEFSVPGESEVCLNITINMRLPGYAPKESLYFLSEMKKEHKDKEKKNPKNKGSKLDGGEGGI